VPADFVDIAGELDAVLRKFFSAAMLKIAGKYGFIRFVFHEDLLVKKREPGSRVACRNLTRHQILLNKNKQTPAARL
jgi:hypothetical protein